MGERTEEFSKEEATIILKIMNYSYMNKRIANFVDIPERESGAVLLLKARDDKKNPHIIQVFDPEELAPRFGILRKEKAIAESLDVIKKIKEGPNSIYGEKTYVCYTKFPFEVKKIRDEFKWTFQADVKWEKMAMNHIIHKCGLESPYIEIPINYAYRYLKVNDIKNVPQEKRFVIEPRLCYWDIETDGRNIISMQDFNENIKSPIVSITAYDNYEDEYWQFVWHYQFLENNHYEFEDYKITDNVETDKEVIIRKIHRLECRTEKDMIKGFFNWFGHRKFDDILGFFSEGGYKKQSFSGSMKRRWINGFDMPFLYRRAGYLGLLEKMQYMSPFPQIKENNRWLQVYARNVGGKFQVVIQGIGQLDWIFSDEVLQVAQKYYDFRGNRLADWMSYFLGFHKLDKGKMNVWEYWEQLDLLEINIDELIEKVEINGESVE